MNEQTSSSCGDSSNPSPAPCGQPETPAGPALTPAQQKALELLAAGATVTQAAQAAGVHRATVHRWLSDDEAFGDAVARDQRHTRQALHARLLAMGEKALAKVEDYLMYDASLAMRLLEKLGAFNGDSRVRHPATPPTGLATADPRANTDEPSR